MNFLRSVIPCRIHVTSVPCVIGEKCHPLTHSPWNSIEVAKQYESRVTEVCGSMAKMEASRTKTLRACCTRDGEGLLHKCYKTMWNKHCGTSLPFSELLDVIHTQTHISGWTHLHTQTSSSPDTPWGSTRGFQLFQETAAFIRLKRQLPISKFKISILFHLFSTGTQKAQGFLILRE